MLGLLPGAAPGRGMGTWLPVQLPLHLIIPLLCCAGAETGAGGRIRDTHATGIGSIMGAATAGYCTGNLHLDE